MSFDAEKFINEVEKRPQLYDSYAEAYKSRAVTRMCWCEVGEAMFPEEWSTLSPATKKIRIKLLIRKWKALRDNFVREYKDKLFLVKKEVPKRRKKHSFYNRLQFLQPYIGGQAAAARIENIVSCDLEFPADSETGYDDSDPLVIPQEDTVYDDTPIVQDDIGDPDDVKPDISIDRFNQCQSISSVNEEELPQPILSLTRKRSDCIAVALKSKKTAIRRSVRASATKTAETEDDVYGHRAFMMSYIPILDSMPLHVAMQARMQISQVMSSSFLENSSQATPTSIVTENSDLN